MRSHFEGEFCFAYLCLKHKSFDQLRFARPIVAVRSCFASGYAVSAFALEIAFIPNFDVSHCFAARSVYRYLIGALRFVPPFGTQPPALINGRVSSSE